MECWSIKYRPKKFTDLKFSNDVYFELLKWFKEKKRDNICNINGASGIGKTSLAIICAQITNFYPIELDNCNIVNLSSILTMNHYNLNKTNNCLIVNEYFLKNEYLLKKLQKSKIPVILITNEMYLKHIKTFKINKPTLHICLNICTNILKLERKYISNQILLKIIKECNYDIRFLLNTLQLILYSDKIDIACDNLILTKNLMFNYANLLNNRYKIIDLENAYKQSFVSDTLFNGVIQHNMSLNILKNIVDCRSLSDIMPDNLKFINLIPYNNSKLQFTFTKFPQSTMQPYSLLPQRIFYSKLYNNDTALDHLKTILKQYDTVLLTQKELDILKRTVPLNIKNKSRIFRYKFKKLTINTIRQDISLDEFNRF